MRYLVFILMIVRVSAYSQKSFFGVEAGINLSNQRISVSSSGKINQITFAQTAPRLTFGLFYQRGVSNVLSIRIGAKYNGFGYKRDDQTYYRPTPGFSSSDLDYITFPLHFVYHANPRLRANVGGYYSILIGGTKVSNFLINDDYGVNFGLEHDLFGNFSIAATYYFGLKNISKIDASVAGYDVLITNRALQIVLIYKLPFGRSAND
jgi:Outer membrane protein beta-barrel domain